MFTLWWLHSAIFQLAAWHHAGQQCAAMCELAGSQLPTGSRMALLARWAISVSRMQLPLSCVMLFSTDHLLFFFSIHSSMICLSKHWGHLTFGTLFTTPCPVAPGQNRWEDCFFSPLLFFSLSWPVKTLQESNPAWHSMLPPTRNNISVWKKTDTNGFLLNFSFGTGTSHQAFSTVFQHLQNHNSFPFLAVGFQCNPPPQKQGASLCVRCEVGEQGGCQMDLQIN